MAIRDASAQRVRAGGVGPRRRGGWSRGLALWLLCALCLGPALALANPLEVYVDQNPVSVGQSLTLTVRIQGRPAGDIKLPKLPRTVNVRGPTQRSVTNIVNFEVERFQEYTFFLTPREAGSFQVDAIVAMVDGKLYRSEPFEVKVVGESRESGEARDLYAKARVSPTSVYPGQQLIYSFSLYRSPTLEVSQFRYAPPTFEGFVEEKLGELGEKTTLQTIDGRRYALQEVRHALFPTRAGPLTVGDATLMVDVLQGRRGRRRGADPFNIFADPFSQKAETREVYAEAIPVQVKPLPRGAPPSFTGVVGHLRVDYRLSSQTLALGESATLTITVEGDGNLRSLNIPDPEVGRFKVYADAPEATLGFNSQTLLMGGKKIFKFALIPLEEGELELSAPSISWLDPETGQYETRRSPPFKVRVTPGQEGETLNVVAAPRSAPQSVEAIGEDILPLKRPATLSKPRPFGPASPLALGLFFAPPLALLGLGLRARYAAGRDKDPRAVRRRRALADAQAALKTLESSPPGDALAGLRELDRILRAYLGDKLGVEGLTQTPQELGDALHEAGIPEGLGAQTIATLRALESAQFAPGSVAAATLGTQRSETAALLKALEGALR